MVTNPLYAYFSLFFFTYEQELVLQDVSSMKAGSESSYFLYDDGTVQSCGRNNEGQLGDGTLLDADKPVDVLIPYDETRIGELGSGPSSASAFFVSEDKRLVYGAGQNYRHQLGIGEVGSRKFPVLVDFQDEPGIQEIETVSASGSHTTAVCCTIFTDIPTSYPTPFPTTYVSYCFASLPYMGASVLIFSQTL